MVSYTYDAWGKVVSVNDTSGISLGTKNSYRYRGYRYDTETGLYYLQSRYYNPEWGRFINADGFIGQIGELTGHNLFAYCRNNPVNMIDKNGYNPVSTGVQIGAGIGTAVEPGAGTIIGGIVGGFIILGGIFYVKDKVEKNY